MAKDVAVKKSALQDALDMINKQQGAGSVYTIGEFKPVPVERLRPGSIGLYDLTGGGYPEGRIIELDGWESSGKTTISLLAVAAAQKKYPSKRVLYIDGEHALDLKYARILGVDTDLMILSQPNCMEEGYRTIEALVKTGEISVVVFDSVAGTITEKELEGELGETSALGVKAKLMSQAMPKFAALMNNTKTTGFWINQFREKIGVMFGSPITTPGGNALKFTASVRLELKQSTKEKDADGDVSGVKIKAKCIKNKTATPFKECEYNIVFGEGIDKHQEIIDYGVALGIINKAGSWFSYGDTKLGQGSNGVKATFKDNPDLVDELEELIYKGLDAQ